jgi:hypothetical protein
VLINGFIFGELFFLLNHRTEEKPTKRGLKGERVGYYIALKGCFVVITSTEG